jgi:hypothetical protein
MRMSRFVPVVAAGALVAATVSPASAAEPGVGTTTAALEAIGLDVGEVLSLSLLTDTGLADTNPADGAVSTASAQLNALEVASELLGVDEQVGLLSAESTGDESSDALPATSVPDTGGVVTGTLDGALSAVVGEGGALSNIDAGVTDLSVLDGIVGIGQSGLDLGAGSAGAQAEGARTFTLEDLSLLDLEALLAGLGIPLTDLPLDQVLGLIGELGVDGLDPILAELGLSAEELLAAVADLGSLTAALEDVSGTTCTLTEDTLGTIGGLLGEEVTVDELCADDGVLVAAIDEIEALLDPALLEDILGLLDGVSLVSLDLLQVGMSTVATDSVDTSSADVAPVIEGLVVGGLPVDAGAALEATEELLATVNAQLDGVLATVGLSDIISIALFDQGATVTEKDGAIVSDAFFTGLGVDIDPGAVLDTVLAALAADDLLSVGDTILALAPDAELPVSPLTLLNDLAGTNVLGDGVSLRVADLGQNSTHVLGATATPQAPTAPELPMTGSSDTLWLFMAAVAAAGALGLRRLTVRSDS